MEKVLKINGKTYVQVEAEDNTFSKIHYVHRKREGSSKWNEGIPFLNKEDAIKYATNLEQVLGYMTVITSELIYI